MAMVTIDINWVAEDSSAQADESTADEPIADETINGIDYVIDSELTFARSDAPEFLDDILPLLDEYSSVTMPVEGRLEILRLSELEEGELTMWEFIPLQWKLTGRPSPDNHGREYKKSLAEIAEGISTTSRQQSTTPRETTEEDIELNLNHLLKHSK